MFVDGLLYDIRPAPVGKSATIDDGASRQSSAKPMTSQQRVIRPRSHSNSHSQPFAFSQSVQDSIKLSKLKNHHKSANIPQTSHRHPFSAGNRLLQVPQRSMPALHIDYHMPSVAQVDRTQVGPMTSDSYLQHAYERILQRRSLLSAIR